MFTYSGKSTSEQMYDEWNKAKKEMLGKAFIEDRMIVWEQEEIIKVLSEKVKGFVFYEDL